MQIYSAMRKGEGHPVFCEDFMFIKKTGGDWVVAAVMDGCSAGADSHFASALMGKILGKIEFSLSDKKEIDLKDASADQIGRYFAENLFHNFTNVNNYLQLDYVEALSTIILLIYHPVKKEAWIMTSGDGYVAIDEEITKIDQNNRPDYMAYHLNKGFVEWFDKHVRIFHSEQAKNIAISTDGIGSFFSLGAFTKGDIDPATELLTFHIHNKMGLDAKIKQIQQEFGLIPYDDISIIRINND